MRHFLLACLLVWGAAACQPQEDILLTSQLEPLTFSSDTVFFDTVFNQIETPVRRLWVRNPNAGAIRLNIALENPESSPFSLVINGVESNESSDIRLLGKDSLLVLVSAKIEEQTANEPLLIEGFIQTQTAEHTQRLPVHAWGRNARLLRDHVVRQDEVWTAERPYVLLSDVLIDTLASLRLEAGVEVYAYPNTFLLVGGRLHIAGTAEEPVLLTGLRQEDPYRDAPGQWGGILTGERSQFSEIHHARIRNAIWGVRAGTPDNDTLPDLLITHTVIENMSDAGILAFSSDILVQNTLINNCLNQTFAGLAGGTYTLEHVTLANFSFDFIRQDPSVIFTNLFEVQGTRFEEELRVNLRNSIVWGVLDDEIFLSEEGTPPVLLSTTHSLLRTTQTERFGKPTNLLNQDPRFRTPFLYDYRLDTLSPAQNAAVPIGLTTDLLGQPRNDEAPDMGAYERQE